MAPPTTKPKNEATEKLEKLKQQEREHGERVALEVLPVTVLKVNDMLLSGRFDYKRLPSVVKDVNIPRPENLMNVTTTNAQKNGPTAGHKHSTDSLEKGGPTLAKRGKMSPIPMTDTHSSKSSTSATASSIEDDVRTAENSTGTTKVISFVCGSVPVNDELSQLIDEVKPVLRDAVEHFNAVKLWILLLIPRMEDGNNFGVSIQEEVLSEVRSVEQEAASFLDALSRYFLSRGRMVTRIARYPHVEDYRKAIVDLDEKQFINIRLVLIEIRNHYSTMHDLICKNLEKIRVPRTSNAHHSMY